jgi:hypothetical protein
LTVLHSFGKENAVPQARLFAVISSDVVGGIEFVLFHTTTELVSSSWSIDRLWFSIFCGSRDAMSHHSVAQLSHSTEKRCSQNVLIVVGRREGMF